MDKRKLTGKDYEKPFPTRLRILLAEKNMTQTDLAEAFKDSGLQVTRQTISSYANGETVPDIMRFKFIADFFKVSYDYLLGASEARERENSHIGQELGLNDDAINELKNFQKQSSYSPVSRIYLQAINLFLSDELDNFFLPIMDYAIVTKGMNSEISDSMNNGDNPVDSDGYVSVKLSRDWYGDLRYCEWVMIEAQKKFAMEMAIKLSKEITENIDYA